jgi:hypothetical protein
MKTFRLLCLLSISSVVALATSLASAQTKQGIEVHDFPPAKEIHSVFIGMKSGWELTVDSDGGGMLVEPLPDGGSAIGFRFRKGTLKPHAILAALAETLQAKAKTDTDPGITFTLQDEKGTLIFYASDEAAVGALFDQCAEAVEAKRKAELKGKMAKYPFVTPPATPSKDGPTNQK